MWPHSSLSWPWQCCRNATSPVDNIRKEINKTYKILSLDSRQSLISATSGAVVNFMFLLFIFFGRLTLSNMPCVLRRRPDSISSSSFEDRALISAYIKQQEMWHLMKIFYSILITYSSFVSGMVEVFMSHRLRCPVCGHTILRKKTWTKLYIFFSTGSLHRANVPIWLWRSLLHKLGNQLGKTDILENIIAPFRCTLEVILTVCVLCDDMYVDIRIFTN